MALHGDYYQAVSFCSCVPFPSIRTSDNDGLSRARYQDQMLEST